MVHVGGLYEKAYKDIYEDVQAQQLAGDLGTSLQSFLFVVAKHHFVMLAVDFSLVSRRYNHDYFPPGDGARDAGDGHCYLRMFRLMETSDMALFNLCFGDVWI